MDEFSTDGDQQLCCVGFDVYSKQRNGAEHFSERNEQGTNLVGELIRVLVVYMNLRRPGHVTASAGMFSGKRGMGMHESPLIVAKISLLYSLVNRLIR